MNKKLNFVFNGLIILLIIALVAVMMNYYYTDTSSVIPTDKEIMKEDIIPNNSDKSYIISNNTENQTPKDNIIDKLTQETQNSGENDQKLDNLNSGDKGQIENEETTKPEGPVSPVIMTSENDISSKEKREILSELDRTLMELLEVVDKVQTVDETRLIIDDSEVQE